MIIFTYIGIAVAFFVALLVLIYLVDVARELIAGIKVTYWLWNEHKELVRLGVVEDRGSKIEDIKATMRFFKEFFGSFRDTKFTSKLGNKYN